MLLAGIAQRVICAYLGPNKINICACALQPYCQSTIATSPNVTWSLSNLGKTRSYSRQCSDEPMGNVVYPGFLSRELINASSCGITRNLSTLMYARAWWQMRNTAKHLPSSQCTH